MRHRGTASGTLISGRERCACMSPMKTEKERERALEQEWGQDVTEITMKAQCSHVREKTLRVCLVWYRCCCMALKRVAAVEFEDERSSK